MEAIIKAKHKRKTIRGEIFRSVLGSAPTSSCSGFFLSWGAVSFLPLVTQHSCLGVHEESDQKTDLSLKIAALE